MLPRSIENSNIDENSKMNLSNPGTAWKQSIEWYNKNKDIIIKKKQDITAEDDA